MRFSQLRARQSYYWTHNDVLELVFCVELSDGTLGFVNRKGERVEVKKEDDIVPFSAEYYNQFLKYDHKADKRNW